MDSQLSNSTTTEPENGSQSLEQLDYAESILSEYEAMLGFPSVVPPKAENEAHRLLDLSPEERRKMTPEDCSEAEYCLKAYYGYLERVISQVDTKIVWLKETIARRIAQYSDNYNGYTFEERRLKATNLDSFTQRLDKTRVKMESIKIRLYSMSKAIYNVAGAFSRRKQ